MNKELLIDAIKGTTPPYTTMDHPLIKLTGYYSGGFNDRWDWNNDGNCYFKHDFAKIRERASK